MSLNHSLRYIHNCCYVGEPLIVGVDEVLETAVAPAANLSKVEVVAPAATLSTDKVVAPVATLIEAEVVAPAANLSKDEVVVAPAATLSKDEAVAPAATLSKDEVVAPAANLKWREVVAPAATVLVFEAPSQLSSPAPLVAYLAHAFSLWIPSLEPCLSSSAPKPSWPHHPF